MVSFIILAFCATAVFAGEFHHGTKTSGSSSYYELPSVSYSSGKTSFSSVPSGGETVYESSAVNGQGVKGSQVVVDVNAPTVNDGSNSVLSGSVVSSGVAPVLPSDVVSGQTVVSGTPSETFGSGFEGQVVSSGPVSTGVTSTVSDPIVTRFTSSAPAYVKKIYQEKTHVHPAKEVVYKVRTAPKVHKEVALVGRVVQHPKINVIQVVKQPDVRKVTTIVKPAQKVTQVLPAKVTHVTRVYKAPEVEYKPKVWYAQKQRETTGSIVSVEKGKVGPQALFEFNAPLPLSGEWKVFESPTFQLSSGVSGVNLGAGNVDLAGAGGLSFDSKTTELNLGGKPGTTGSTTVHKTADGTTTTTTNFHSHSGVQGEEVSAGGSIGLHATLLDSGVDALNPFSFGPQQGLQGQTSVQKGADGSTITTTTYHSNSGLQGTTNVLSGTSSGVQTVLDGVQLASSGFGQEDTQVKSELLK